MCAQGQNVASPRATALAPSVSLCHSTGRAQRRVKGPPPLLHMLLQAIYSALFMHKTEPERRISEARTAIRRRKREPEGAFSQLLDPLYGPPKKATARIRTGDLLQS